MSEVLTPRETQVDRLSLTNSIQRRLIERFMDQPQNEDLDDNQVALRWIQSYSAKFRELIDDPKNLELLEDFETGDEDLTLAKIESLLY